MVVNNGELSGDGALDVHYLPDITTLVGSGWLMYCMVGKKSALEM